MMLKGLVAVEALEPYRLRLEFEDGVAGEVYLRPPADIEAAVLSRQVLAPGDSMPLSLFVGTHVRIREVPMNEVSNVDE